MMSLTIIVTAFFASLLTLFSGFGLGTILMPVVAVFFPVTTAVAMTAFVHLLNSLFKLTTLWKYIDWRVTARFGIAVPAGELAQALQIAIQAIEAARRRL